MDIGFFFFNSDDEFDLKTAELEDYDLDKTYGVRWNAEEGYHMGDIIAMYAHKDDTIYVRSINEIGRDYEEIVQALDFAVQIEVNIKFIYGKENEILIGFNKALNDRANKLLNILLEENKIL